MNEQTIFGEALELPTDLRADYVRKACCGNEQLLARVERLLQLHDQAGSFMESPAVDPGSTCDVTSKETVGKRIGPYKLLQEIGQGGMGTVYMAEQQLPVKRRVALKIIKAGMDSKQVIARFEAERQALALMDHPNIARVLDAGTTEAGLPYFVMELVNGIPLTEYCDQQHLTPRQRLELFLPVCQAVQHAHHKGVIHRDLKPSNILVALYDGHPVPKVIDFGVAKAVGHSLTDNTMFTALGQIIGTLEYMSPEQAQRNQLDIDTRSDIYSLGVVLYELLTGDTPFDRQRLRSVALEELLRIFREEDPPSPSTRISTSHSAATIASNRHSQPSKLSSLLRGELDWIVMRALEKDRNRRYETANALMLDVQRYLRDEPVMAGPPSTLYKLKKFARKHRTILMTLGLLGMVLFLGMITSLWQANRALRSERAAQALVESERRLRQQENDQRRRAELAEQRAEEKAAIAQAINDFLVKDLLALSSAEGQVQAGLTADPELKLVTALDRAAQLLPERFAANTPERIELTRTLAVAYQGLGRYTKAAHHWQVLLQQELKDGNATSEPVTTAKNNLAQSLSALGRWEDAVVLFEEVLASIQEKDLGSRNDWLLRNNLGYGYLLLGKYDRAVPHLEQAKQILEGQHPESTSEYSLILSNLALAYRELDRIPESIDMAQQAFSFARRTWGDDHPNTLAIHSNLGAHLFSCGEVNQGLEVLNSSLSQHERILGAEHPDTLHALKNYALMLHRSGRSPEGLELTRQAYDRHKRHPELGKNHPETLYVMTNLAICLDAVGQNEAALETAEECLTLMQKHLPEGHPYTQRTEELVREIKARNSDVR